MTERDLQTIYRGYLNCLNERQWSRLGEYVAEELSYNGERRTLADYQAMLEKDTHAIPDLQFTPELLLADDSIVACRLAFRCTPRHEFLGFEPTGGQISFSENVFYRFDDEWRIVDVWSVIDLQAIREQVSQA